MILKRLFILIIIFFIGIVVSNGQNYNISNSTVSTCTGNFYDSNGPGGNYFNNENYTMTFCSSVSGECVQLLFSSLDLEDGYDFLTVYNGPNTGSPVLGSYTGNNTPGVLTATSGCLTIEFTSDFTGRAAGWEASINCVPCPGSLCPSCNGGAAPANDACSGAMNLGALPAPAACPNGIGTWANFNTTNICATAENPYTTLTGCQPAGNMASPAADVWYRFTITGPTLNINIAGMQTPNIGLYTGSNCNNLVGRGCAIGGGGILNTSFGGLAPGTYFLQVSGGNLNDQCAFTLSLQNNFDCAGCVIQSSFTAAPPPVNGTYLASQTVTFCYTITDYNQTSINWLHGIVPSFGSGWDMSTLVTNPPVSCSGQGTWSWYNTNVTSTATGQVTGPGFYFESQLGNAGGVLDGNPGNNFGDNNPGNTCDWTFCWTITTLPPSQCTPGASLNITVDTYGDGESGSWTSLACVGDPVADFFATLTCCASPQVAITDPSCFGVNNGSVIGSGQGNAPWDYIWKNSAGVTIQTVNNVNGTNTINNLAPGNYSLTCNDNAGCSATINFTITTPVQIVANTIPVAASCFGSSDGSASVNVIGGAIPYQYQWAPSGGSGSTASGLLAGTYTVTVTDNNGCTSSAQAVVPQPNQIAVNIVSVDANCGASNGSLTINVVGGVGVLQYSNNGGTSFQAGNGFFNLAAGNYNVIVKDANGCLGTAAGQINNLSGPSISLAPVTNVSCNGGTNGTITVNTIGGTGVLQFSNDNGASFQASNVFNNLGVGSYDLIVEDANGCQATLNVSITEPPLLTLSIVGTAPTCGLPNGSITTNAAGGINPIQYSLNGGANQASANFTNLVAGNYTVIVTDVNNCTATASTILVSDPPLILNTVSTNSTCGNSNGILGLSAVGGDPAYIFNLNGGAPQGSGTFSNLTAGNYTVMVTDEDGCTASSLVVVVDEPGPAVTSTLSNEVTCYGASNGSITVNITGGTAPIQYSSNGGAFQTSNTFNNLFAGNYVIIVRDANGCTDQVNVAIGEPIAVLALWIAGNSTCGLSNGSVTINAAGGVGVLQYSIDGGPFQLSNTFNNLPAGNYVITVSDGNGCLVVANTSVSNVPGPIIPNVNSTNVTCNGGNDGSLVIITLGGTLPLQYSIDNGTTYQASDTFSGLSAGNQTILVTDGNGCTVATNVMITEPLAISPNEIVTGTTCGNINGSVTINAIGGTGALQFSLDGGPYQATGSYSSLAAGNYNYDVLDANACHVSGSFAITDAPGPVITSSSSTNPNCNGSSNGGIQVTAVGGTNPKQFEIVGGAVRPNGTFNGLAAGTYTVIVTDANGCVDSISVTVNDTPALVLVANPTPSTCGNSNGSINVVANGGTGVIEFALGAGPYQPSNTFTNLAAGNYTVKIRDANGCTLSAPVIITDEPAPTISNVPITNINCNGENTGTISVDAVGGSGLLNYSLNGGGAQASNTFSNLTAGVYSILVVDANGCTVTSNVVLSEPSALLVNTSIVSTLCSASNGSITLNVNGATPAYQFSLDGGPNQAANIFSSLLAGNYAVTVSDANGCTTIANVIVGDNPAPVISNTDIVNAPCFESDAGSIDVTTTGGLAPLTYSLNGGATQATGFFPGLIAGVYDVLITDANGCTVNANYIVTEPTEITMSSIVTPSTCGNANGSIVINANGGTGALSYSINSGVSQPVNTFANLISGNYNLTITDVNGCELKVGEFVPDQPGPVIDSIPGVDALCFGAADGSLIIHTSGGTGALSYSIDNGATSQPLNTFSNLAAGTYDVIITDANGCTSVTQTILNEPTKLQLNGSTTSSFCSGNNGEINVNANGGTGSYQFSIDGGPLQSGTSFSNLLSGSYNITVTDGNGCTLTEPFQVTDQPAPIISSAPVVDALCFGSSDGSIIVNANGGTGVLSYSIDNGSTNQLLSDFNLLAAGNYTILVTDANGCTVEFLVTINEPSAVGATDATTPASCGNSDGTTTVSGNGGIPGYQYSIDNGITFQVSGTFSNLLAGNYDVIVKDANGCTFTITSSISNTAAPIISAVNATNVNCFNSDDGTITINANNGTAPLQYSIDNGSNFLLTNSFSNLAPGNYNIIVEDALGCQTTSSISITEPALLTIANQLTNTTCSQQNGAISIVANGGTAPYTYSINGGTTQQITGNFNNLNSGNYNVLVTDDKGCIATEVEILSDAPSPLIQSITETNINCNGASNGQIVIVSNGGTGAIQYSIDNGVTLQISGTFTNLSPGTYDVVIADANNCSTSSTATITEPVALQFNTNSSPASCGNSDGTLTINANGGTGIYQYSIDNGTTFQPGSTFSNIPSGNYLVVVTDANNCSVSGNGIVNNAAAPLISATAITNVTCYGMNNGTISITANGGTGALQYSINNGTTFQAGNGFTNLAPGTYDLIVEDINGCEATASIIITEPDAITAVINTVNTTCSNNNGSLSIVAAGGVGIYQYSNNNGSSFQPNSTFLNLLSGNYDVVIQDANNCTVTYATNITDSPGPAIQALNSSDLTCNGSNDGTITVTATGGTAPLEFSIDGGTNFQSTQLFSNLSPGNYSVVISDANGCTISSPVVISEPVSISASFTSTDASCGNSDGTITVTAIGGSGALQYSIDNGASFQSSINFNSLLAGSYNIIIRDINLCQMVLVAAVNNAAAPSILNTTVLGITCNNADDGSIVINASGGTGALSYSINGGTTSQAGNTFLNLPPGIYNIVVTDVNGCEATSQQNLIEPLALTATSIVTTATCGNNNGSILINAVGGTGNLQYSNNGGTSFQNNSLFNSLGQGLYSIIVTDANGCSFSFNKNVPNAAGPIVSNVFETDITCNGFNDGALTIISNGGTAPVQYSINNGLTFAPGFVFGALSPGTYNIIVSDANGCTSTYSSTLTQPVAVSFTSITIDANCGNSDGGITITPSGGSGNYSFSIDNGSTFQPSSTFTSLPAGTYMVLVRDGSDCTFSTQVIINNAAAPSITNTPFTNISCNGLNDGTITISTSGGVSPLTYSIDGGFTWSPSGSFTNLPAGIFSILVSDVNGCEASASVTLTEPDAIVLSNTSVNATCGSPDGSILVNASGGSGTLNFSINGSVSQSSGAFNNLAAGNYNVIATDASGCTELLVASVSNTNAPVITSISGTDISCFGADNGTVNINASGGSGVLSYSINNGSTFFTTGIFNNLPPGIYSISVEDTIGCVATGNITILEPDELIVNTLPVNTTCGNTNGEIHTLVTGGTGIIQYSINSGTSYQFTGTFINLTQGNYNVIISDANGCTATATSFLNNIPGPLVSTIPVTNSTCNNSDDGSFTVQLTGGTGPFQYSLNGGSTSQMLNYFGSLAPGTYQIHVTDANGCVADSSAQISEPTALTISSTFTGSTCSSNNASLTLNGTGGTGNYTFSNNGGLSYQATGLFNNLTAGNYIFSVQDSNGCTLSDSTIIPDAPSPLVQSVLTIDPLCNGSSDGSIALLVSGGTLPLQYSVDNGATYQTSNTFSNLLHGVYTITVMDANSCTASSSGTLTEPSAILMNTSSTPTLCSGSSDGLAEVFVIGGVEPYLYTWSSGSTTIDASNLIAGTYTVTVTDNNGCTAASQVIVDEPDSISVQSQIINISCFGFTDGEIELNTNGGTAPFTYAWSTPSLSGHDNNSLVAGTYSVVISDANGCTLVQSYTITEPDSISLSSSATPTLCFGSSNGTAIVNASGGTGPFTYSWSNGSSTATANSLTAGIYTVTVTDSNGCSSSTIETITSPDQLAASLISTPATCNGYADGSAILNVAGGTLPYTYLWNNGATTGSLNGAPGGTYSVTVTDFNNCNISASVIIQQPTVITVNVSGAAIICIGQSTLISATAQGGNGGFQYLWNNGVTTSSQSVNPVNTNTYTVTITDSLGCQANGASVTVSVNPPLALSISPPDTICEGESVSISAIASGGDGGPYSYSWSGSTTVGSQINVTPTATTNYIVTVSDGCGTPAVNVNVTILVNELPQVNFIPIPAEGCAPLEVYFDNNTITSTTGAFYQWYFGDNTNSNDFSPSHWYTEPGYYTVMLKVTSAEGCSSELTIQDAIKVFPVPDASVGASPMVTSILNPEISFTDYGNGSTWWNWDFGDNSSYNNEPNTQHSYDAPGIYNVVLYVMNDFGCRDTAYTEILIEGASTVYIPNAFTPNGDGINDIFNVSGIGLNGVQMSIFNRWGNKIFISSNLNNGWDGYDQSTGAKCPVGVYLYTVKVKNFKGEFEDFTGRVTLLE